MATGNSVNMDETGVQTYNTSTGNLTGSTTTQYNLLIGDTNNKLTNVAPHATSGIPVISSGAAANPAYGTAVVAGGGTGNTTFTAYSVICAGTTATGAFQNVSGLGKSGQWLGSNGASALPTWGDIGGYTLQMRTANGNPADSTTYFMRNYSAITISTTAQRERQLLIPVRSGTISAVYGEFMYGSNASSENVSVILRINNTTDVTVSSTVQLTTTPSTTFSNTSLTQAVSVGDYIEIKVVTPAWVTNPLTVNFNCTLLMS